MTLSFPLLSPSSPLPLSLSSFLPPLPFLAPFCSPPPPLDPMTCLCACYSTYGSYPYVLPSGADAAHGTRRSEPGRWRYPPTRCSLSLSFCSQPPRSSPLFASPPSASALSAFALEEEVTQSAWQEGEAALGERREEQEAELKRAEEELEKELEESRKRLEVRSAGRGA
eukprot:1962865-Rhodomonas_salina.1